jgi:hypothetical protein
VEFDRKPEFNGVVTHETAGTSVPRPPEPAHEQHEFHHTQAAAASPVTPQAEVATTVAPGVMPMPVVHVLSPRGVEYVFLTINLFTAAIGLMSVLIALVNSKLDFTVLAFPVALLVVSVPLFALLFLRLKRAELRDPSLRADVSKRRSTQFTQIVAYLAVFFSLIGLVSAGFAKASGVYDGNFLKLCLDVLVIVVVAGGVLAYYWRDEHKA